MEKKIFSIAEQGFNDPTSQFRFEFTHEGDQPKLVVYTPDRARTLSFLFERNGRALAAGRIEEFGTEEVEPPPLENPELEGLARGLPVLEGQAARDAIEHADEGIPIRVNPDGTCTPI